MKLSLNEDRSAVDIRGEKRNRLTKSAYDMYYFSLVASLPMQEIRLACVANGKGRVLYVLNGG